MFLIARIVRPTALISSMAVTLRDAVTLVLVVILFLRRVSSMLGRTIVELILLTGVTSSRRKTQCTLIINIASIQEIIFNSYVIYLRRSIVFLVVISVTSKLSFGNIVVTVHVNNLNWVVLVVIGLFGAVHMISGGVAELIVAVQLWRALVGILLSLSSLCTLASLSTLNLLLAIFVEKSVIVNLIQLYFCKIFIQVSLLRWCSIPIIFWSIWLILPWLLLICLSQLLKLLLKMLRLIGFRTTAIRRVLSTCWRTTKALIMDANLPSWTSIYWSLARIESYTLLFDNSWSSLLLILNV